jgi:predicted DNA-binding transcriptional regulator AlpA
MSQQNLDLIGTHDIARMLGVTQSHCVGRIIKRPDFPKPAINLSQRLRKWKREDVMKFLGVVK